MVGCLLSACFVRFRAIRFLICGVPRGLYAAGSPAVPAYALRLVAAHFALCVPLGPFMILNMAGNRKRAFKKRAQAAHPRPLAGLVWPVTGTKNGAPARQDSAEDFFVD